ncbi:hypothetical protein C8R44DRAFT_750734 [Mycena epipterygia]|nr:hypothetical protein C8R44DRAFT_750734 [Mycena epipterygia]
MTVDPHTSTSAYPVDSFSLFLPPDVSTFSAVLVYCFITGLAFIRAIIPTCWWNPGLNWGWDWRKSTFFNHAYDVISMVPLLFGDPCCHTSSPDVVRQLVSDETKTGLVKPPWLMAPLLYSLVVAETIALFRELIATEGWKNRDEATVGDNNYSTSMSFGDALPIVTQTAISRLILPNWAYKLGINISGIPSPYLSSAGVCGQTRGCAPPEHLWLYPFQKRRLFVFVLGFEAMSECVSSQNEVNLRKIVLKFVSEVRKLTVYSLNLGPAGYSNAPGISTAPGNFFN